MSLLSLFEDLNNFKYYTSKGYIGDGGQPSMKSLKYGHDRIDGGSSNQPYIKTPINVKLPPALNFLGTDFILRGGPVGAPLATANDVLRLTRYFTDTKTPSGLLFIAKQNLLSRTAVETEASGKFINEGVYTPLSTLAQAGVSAFGLHLNKQGLNPIPGAPGSLRTYQSVVTRNNAEETNSIQAGYTPEIINPGFFAGISNELFADNLNNFTPAVAKYTNRLLKYWYYKQITKNATSDLTSYKGGPGSVLGIGNTLIKFATDAYGQPLRTGVNNSEVFGSGFFTSEEQGYYDFNVFTKPRPTTYQASRIFNKNNLSAIYSNLIFDNYNTLYSGEFFNADGDQDDLLKFNPNVYSPSSSGEPTFEVDNEKLKSGIITRNVQGDLITIQKPLGVSELYKNLEPSSSENLTTSFLFIKTSLLSGSVNPQYGSGAGPQNVYSFANNKFGTATILENIGGAYVFTQQQLIDKKPYQDGPITELKDFRKTIRDRIKNDQIAEDSAYKLILSNSPDYSTKNIENRIDLGDPGNKSGKNIASYTLGVGSGNASANSYDKMALVPLYSSNAVRSSIPKDLVNFRIAAIDNDDPTQKVYIHFRAFLGSISDSYSGKWNTSRYVGRGEDFYTYDGFSRKISLSFTIAAQSKIELIPLYEKLNYLISNMAPDYSDVGYMRGPLVTLTIGGYILEMPGFIEGMSIEMGEETTWEIGIDDAGEPDNSVKQLAHVIKVSGFSFTPIHRFAPRKADVNNLKATKYILNELPPNPPPPPPVSSQPAVKELPVKQTIKSPPVVSSPSTPLAVATGLTVATSDPNQQNPNKSITGNTIGQGPQIVVENGKLVMKMK